MELYEENDELGRLLKLKSTITHQTQENGVNAVSFEM